MKENSIKKEIDILRESIIEEKYHLYLKDVKKYLKNVINDYKKMQKENEELKKFITEGITIEPNSPYKNYRLDFFRENFIPIKKIQDMIKELEEQDRKWTEELEEPYSNFKNVDRNLKRIKNQVDVLEELLKEDKLYGR